MRWFNRRSLVPSEPEASGRLESLMPLISRGDREAFAELFDTTSAEVRSELARRFTDPREVSRVCGAVYIEVWWLAGCWTGHDGDVRAWIGDIVRRRAGVRILPARRGGDRLRAARNGNSVSCSAGRWTRSAETRGRIDTGRRPEVSAHVGRMTRSARRPWHRAVCGNRRSMVLVTARGPVVAVMGGAAAGRATVIRRLVTAGPPVSAGVADFLTHLCRVAARELPATGVGVSLTAGDGTRSLCAASDDLGEHLEDLQFVLGEGPCVEAYATRRPVLCGDLSDLEPGRWPVYGPMVREAGINAVFAFPLQIGAARLGTMDVLRNRAGSLTAGEIETALLIADIGVDVLLAGREDIDELVGDAGNRTQLFHAQGMVMVQLGVSLHEALTRMRAYAYANDRRLADVARDVVDRTLRFDRDAA